MERAPTLLTVRRILESFNSSFHAHPLTARRHGTNRLYMHPEDLAALGAVEDEAVRISSEHGQIVGHDRPDRTMRRGVVSMTHCWGSPTDTGPLGLRGAHTGRLVSLHADVQSINRMPRQSGVPVDLAPVGVTLDQGQASVANASS